MNILKVAGKDISSIFKNKFIRISVIAIIVVPLLYSLLYLAAFWDPYSRLDKLPVAVVNLDKGTIYDGKTVNYGNDTIKELKDDKELGWNFVSLEDAVNGVNGSKYYSMFIIPEEFSKNVVSGNTSNPVKPEITYASNDKKNFLAAQIGGKVEVLIKEKIASSISKEYTEVTFNKLYDLKDGMKTAADGSDKLRDGIETLQGNIPQLEAGVTSLTDGSLQLKKGLYDLKTETSALPDASKKLLNGATAISSGLASLKDETKALPEGTKSLVNGSVALNSGLKDALDGTKALAEGSTTLSKGYNNVLLPSVDKLNEGATALSTGLSSATDGASALLNGVNGDGTAANPGLINAAKSLEQGSASLNTGVNQLNQGTEQLSQSSKAIIDGGNNLINSYSSIQSGYGQVKNGTNTLISQVQGSYEIINDIGDSIKQYVESNPDAMNDPNIKKILGDLNTLASSNNPSQIQQLQQGLGQVSQGLEYFENNGLIKYTTGVKSYVDGTNSAIAAVNEINKGASEFASGATNYSNGASKFATGAKALANGITSAISGSNELSTGINTLYSNLTDENSGLGAGVTAIKNGAEALNTGIDKLYNGSNDLKSGLVTLNDSTPKLVDGINKLYDGSVTLKNGIATLNSSTPIMISGINKLYDGSVKINGGLNSLSSKIPELKDGVTKLKDGSTELATKLKDGYDTLNSSLVNSSTTMGDFVSSPLEMQDTAVTSVADYGTGFAPYFIPLSLWVGAIMMFFVISTKVDEKIGASKISKVLGKYLSYSFIGVLQAVLASLAVLALGLKPDNMLAYFMINIIMSLTFVAIIQALISILGDAGRLLAIILLILQLTSCAGTFPLELVPNFFKVLNPFMPFTYGVTALRESISGTSATVIFNNSMVLVAVLIVFLIISILLGEFGEKIQQKFHHKKKQLA